FSECVIEIVMPSSIKERIRCDVKNPHNQRFFKSNQPSLCLDRLGCCGLQMLHLRKNSNLPLGSNFITVDVLLFLLPCRPYATMLFIPAFTSSEISLK